jgi:hypothetical protein
MYYTDRRCARQAFSEEIKLPGVQKRHETTVQEAGSYNIGVLLVSLRRGNGAKVIAPNEPINTGDGHIGRGRKKPARRMPGIVLQGDFVYTG